MREWNRSLIGVLALGTRSVVFAQLRSIVEAAVDDERIARNPCAAPPSALRSGFTLRVYTHLMPASEERTRRAIDDVFGEGGSGADVLYAS